MALLEAVPNISEGRDETVIEAVADAARGAGAYIADIHTDADHNRSVYTLLAEPDVLATAVGALAMEAAERIDLLSHDGVHPRVGACDVAPIVPLDELAVWGGTQADALRVANIVCDHISDAGVPAIRYGIGAGDDRIFAGALRNGGAAGLAARLAAGDVVAHRPGQAMHPTAGATLVGVRRILIAFNVLLRSDNLDLAQRIARGIRERDGGLPGVRALGLQLTSSGFVQVSCNIERWKTAGIARVLDAICDLADRAPVDVDSCELVGLAPQAALEELGPVLARRGIRLAAAVEPALDVHVRRALG